MNRLLIALPLLIFAVLGATLYAGLQRDDPRNIPSAFIGQPAPALGTLAQSPAGVGSRAGLCGLPACAAAVATFIPGEDVG